MNLLFTGIDEARVSSVLITRNIMTGNYSLSAFAKTRIVRAFGKIVCFDIILFIHSQSVRRTIVGIGTVSLETYFRSWIAGRLYEVVEIL